MSYSEIISASKHGPEPLLSLLFGMAFTWLLNGLGIVEGVQVSFCLPISIVVFWIFYAYVLRSVKWINRLWLYLIKGVTAESKFYLKDFKRDTDYATFLAQIELTNSGFKEINYFRILMWIPRSIISENINDSLEDSSKSNMQNICIKVPNVSGNNLIYDGKKEYLNMHLIVRDNQINLDLLSSKIKAEAYVEGVKIFCQERTMESLLKTERIDVVRVTGIKTA